VSYRYYYGDPLLITRGVKNFEQPFNKKELTEELVRCEINVKDLPEVETQEKISKTKILSPVICIGGCAALSYILGYHEMELVPLLLFSTSYDQVYQSILVGASSLCSYLANKLAKTKNKVYTVLTMLASLLAFDRGAAERGGIKEYWGEGDLPIPNSPIGKWGFQEAKIGGCRTHVSNAHLISLSVFPAFFLYKVLKHYYLKTNKQLSPVEKVRKFINDKIVKPVQESTIKKYSLQYGAVGGIAFATTGFPVMGLLPAVSDLSAKTINYMSDYFINKVKERIEGKTMIIYLPRDRPR
jgi:hypothetical protein